MKMTSPTTYWGLARETDEGFTVDTHISEAEFSRYVEAIGQVDRLRLQQQYALVERNYRRLRTIREYYNNGFSVGTLGRKDFDEAIFSYNSELVNWLTSTRLFLDHNKVALKREYGDEPGKVEAFHHARQTEHSNSAAYRVLYNLRDYAQHCGFPVTEISTFLKNGIDRSDGIELRLLLNRDELLGDSFDWKRGPRSDLEGLDETFEIDGMAVDFMESLRRLHWLLIDDRVRAAAEVHSTIEEAYERFDGDAGGARCLIRLVVERDEQGAPYFSQLQPYRIPIELSRRVVETVHGNGRPSDLIRLLGEQEGGRTQIDTDEDFERTVEIGSGVVAAYIEGGLGASFAKRVNLVAAETGSMNRVVDGTTVVAYIALQMVATMHGTSPSEILGSLASSGRTTRTRT